MVILRSTLAMLLPAAEHLSVRLAHSVLHNLPISLRINTVVSPCSVRAKLVLHPTENRLEHVEILLHDFPLVLGQLEQVVDRPVDLGFEVVDVRPFDLLPVGFQPVK